MRVASPKLPIIESLSLLRALKEGPMVETDLLEKTGLARSTFFRMRSDLRELLGVDIKFDAAARTYSIADYGLINRRKL